MKQNDELVKSGADSSKDGAVARSGSIVREKSNNVCNILCCVDTCYGEQERIGGLHGLL